MVASFRWGSLPGRVSAKDALGSPQPVLLLAVDQGGDVDGAGVDLLALVQLGEGAPLFQGLGADGGDVHEGLGALGGLLGAVDLLPGGEVAPVCRRHGGIVDPDVLQVGGEGGVAAVVGPVGVHHADFGDGGVPVLGVPEIGLQKPQVVQVHGEAQLLQEGLQPRGVQGGKAGEGLHHGGHVVGANQGLGLLQGGLPALHGVDEVALDLLHVPGGKPSLQEIDLGVGHQGALRAAHEGDALGAGVGALVELSRQGLHGKEGVVSPGLGEGLVPGDVHLGLGEDGGFRRLVDGGVDVLHVIAVQDAYALQVFDAQKAPQV